MRKIIISLSIILLFPLLIGFGFAQGKHTSSLDRCVRNCDMSYKSCMSSKKKSAHCAEKRRACRTSCAKSHGK